MSFSYYEILTVSYLSALALWWGLYIKPLRFLFPAAQPVIEKPWKQTGLVVVAAVLVIAIGRLYSAGLLLPRFDLGSLRLSECINQALIFSPIPLFFLLFRQTFESGWLPSKHLVTRLLLGVALGIIALMVFCSMAAGRGVVDVLKDVFHTQNTHYAVQIFLEDMAIALLLSRLSTALGKKYFLIAIAIVAILFSAGHIPENLDNGVPIPQILFQRTCDAGLTFLAGFSLYRAKDFLWLFPIHFCMDMMQFYSGMTC